jgi:hypothetical protein
MRLLRLSFEDKERIGSMRNATITAERLHVDVKPEHIVLLGDSTFDNAAYTRGEPSVIAHLASALPGGWRATLAAVDGATTRTLRPQLARVPSDATHLVISVGGNDALANIDLLSLPVRSTADALALFGARVSAFEAAYADAVEAAASLTIPMTLCTIYNGRLPDPAEAALARIALMMFNDVIVRTALARKAGIIDLRLVCAAPEDYANPIEPSGQGGRKIAGAVVAAVESSARGL